MTDVLEIRPNCECCGRDLAVDAPDVFICTFECTWCAACVENLADHACPNCGGNLSVRPIRPAELLAAYPPSTTRVTNPDCAPSAGRAGAGPIAAAGGSGAYSPGVVT